MFLILLILFTVVPAVEFYILYRVGVQIGALNTFSLIILTGVVGAALAKSQGMSILFKIQNEIRRGQMPASQIVHGFLVFGGGLLLLTPGFITDILGFSFVAPGSRHLIVKILTQQLKKSMAKGAVIFKTSKYSSDSEFGYYSDAFRNSDAFYNEDSSIREVKEEDVIEVSSKVKKPRS